MQPRNDALNSIPADEIAAAAYSIIINAAHQLPLAYKQVQCSLAMTH